MQDWQQRIVNEQIALSARLQALEGFFETETFRDLDEAEKTRLTIQRSHMRGYNRTLIDRMDAWPPEPAVPEVEVVPEPLPEPPAA